MADETVGTVLASALARGGDRVALRARGELRTHRQVLDNAARFANALAGKGVRPGEQVALMVSDRVEAAEAYVGCLLGGYAAVHVNDRLAGNEVRAVLADADARAFVYTDELSATISELDAVAETDVVVAIGETADGGHVSWASMLDAASRSVPRAPRHLGDLAIVGYTSGTTGRPKGVMHSQQTLLRILQHIPVHFDIRPRSRCAFTGTLSFASAIWGVLLPTLFLGGEVSFMAGLDPDEWFDRMVNEGSDYTYVADTARRSVHRAAAPAPGGAGDPSGSHALGLQDARVHGPAARRGSGPPLRRGLRHDRDRGARHANRERRLAVDMPGPRCLLQRGPPGSHRRSDHRGSRRPGAAAR